jgi:TonB family protein
LTAKAIEPAPLPAESAPVPVLQVQQQVAPRVYALEDAGVNPPVTISQAIPPFPGPIPVIRTGVVEVVINEAGEVESAVMRAPLTPQFDKLVLSAAQEWQYEPARVNGVPVKFVKRIQVRIAPRN